MIVRITYPKHGSRKLVTAVVQNFHLLSYGGELAAAPNLADATRRINPGLQLESFRKRFLRGCDLRDGPAKFGVFLLLLFLLSERFSQQRDSCLRQGHFPVDCCQCKAAICSCSMAIAKSFLSRRATAHDKLLLLPGVLLFYQNSLAASLSIKSILTCKLLKASISPPCPNLVQLRECLCHLAALFKRGDEEEKKEGERNSESDSEPTNAVITTWWLCKPMASIRRLTILVSELSLPNLVQH